MKWYFVACIFLLVSKSVQSKSSQQILDEVKEIAKKSCTAENVQQNNFYFAHPEKKHFIQCDKWGKYRVMQCAPGAKVIEIARKSCTKENNYMSCTTTILIISFLTNEEHHNTSCLQILVSLPYNFGQPTKDIVTEGKVGDDIVERVLDVLTSYNISFDRKCLQDLAFLRSNNGVPYITGKGGIWRVNSSQLTDAQTACQTSLFNQCRISKLLTGEEVSSFDIADLDKPLYSALAMIFYVLSLDKSIPIQDYEKYCKLPIKPLKLSNQEPKDGCGGGIGGCSNGCSGGCEDDSDIDSLYIKINERMLKRIQEACKKALSSTCDLYKEIFHYDISSATINDMDKPLYSGLMIFLYILSLDEPIPENRREQAIYWRKHVNLDGKLGDYLTHSDQILGFENIETPCSGNLVNSSGPPYCKMPNVCSRSAIEKEDIYFPYTDPRIFVKCLDTYKYYIMSCPPDFVWSQTTDACIPQNAGNDNKAYQYSRTTGGSTAIVNSMQLILISFSIYLIELYL
ncbi:collagen alpha-1(XIV) chain-like [Octopus vulgaris]|uniref:Collagen alpha-1(XIV) chain-like n=1 Tax=Octopus vulgaris TaxID=6645 RepID=A0AA36EW17_OCTVU|nr:collagen alpha-1(XIV) chain-like [Octopus vulgaris]